MDPAPDSPTPVSRGWKSLFPEPLKRPLRPLWKKVTEPKPFDYFGHRTRELQRLLGDPQFLADFAANQPLPDGFGHGFDERLVEFPWLLSRLAPIAARTLDLGSTLNHEFILTHERIAPRDLTIVTLEPEDVCFWQRRISYLYCDARALPFRDGWFDEVISISTLEHIGLDNTRFYSQREAYRETNRRSYLVALTEMWRVLKSGGTMLLTIPFGRALDYQWFQQFDGAMVDEILATLAPAHTSETYYRYRSSAWVLTDRAGSADAESFHDAPDSGKGDIPKASGAIVALRLQKAG